MQHSLDHVLPTSPFTITIFIIFITVIICLVNRVICRSNGDRHGLRLVRRCAAQKLR